MRTIHVSRALSAVLLLLVGSGGTRAECVYLGSVDTPGDALDVAVSGTILAVADGGEGIRLIDVSDPTNPTARGGWQSLFGWAGGVAVSGDAAYLAMTDLISVDITDPDAPREAGTLSCHLAEGVCVQRDRVYVADHREDLVIADISAPGSPLLLSRTSFVEDPLGFHVVRVEGDLAFLLGCDERLFVIDVADPYAPVVLATYPLPFAANWGLAVHHSSVYAMSNGVLHILDMTDPTSPVLRSSLDIQGAMRSLAVDWPFVYAGSYGASEPCLAVVDVSDPGAPVVRRRVPLPPSPPDGIAIADGYVYATHGSAGLAVLTTELDPAAAASAVVPVSRSVWVCPNPFEGSGALVFDAPVAGPATLEVFDPAGRRLLLRNLALREAGRQSVALSSSTDLEPGLHFVRIAQAGSVLRGRFVNLR
jgi:hypothetical protein